ncbi:MAG: hypothetical protein ACR2JC_01035 [Chloroflexota bacterium]
MKLLLTSAGISNPSIHDALAERGSSPEARLSAHSRSRSSVAGLIETWPVSSSTKARSCFKEGHIDLLESMSSGLRRSDRYGWLEVSGQPTVRAFEVLRSSGCHAQIGTRRFSIYAAGG